MVELFPATQLFENRAIDALAQLTDHVTTKIYRYIVGTIRPQTTIKQSGNHLAITGKPRWTQSSASHHEVFRNGISN
jgi:hypothetical protein